jgi:hypothetical protein
MMKLQEFTLRKVRLPLFRPYVLSHRTFTEFEPIIVEVRDGNSRLGQCNAALARTSKDAVIFAYRCGATPPP